MKRFNVYSEGELLGFVIAKNFDKARQEASKRWSTYKSNMTLSLVSTRA